MTPSPPSLTGAAARSAPSRQRIGSRHVGSRSVAAALTGLLALVTPAAARPVPRSTSPMVPSLVGATGRAPAACGPVDDSWRTPEHARLHAGTYRLTLVEDTPEPGATSVA